MARPISGCSRASRNARLNSEEQNETRRRPQYQTRRFQRHRHARRRRRLHRARGARALRPDEALHAADLGRRADRRTRGHRAGAAGRQLDDPCRGRAVPERRRAGGRLHRRQYRRHVRRIAGDRAGRARRDRPRHRRRLPRREAAHGDGLPGLVEGDLGQGHGQGDARRGQYSGGVRAASMSSRATWWWPTTTASW